MLEWTNYNIMKLVWPFFGEKVDVICEGSRTASVKAVFIHYDEVNNFVVRRLSSPGWSKTKLGDF